MLSCHYFFKVHVTSLSYLRVKLLLYDLFALAHSNQQCKSNYMQRHEKLSVTKHSSRPSFVDQTEWSWAQMTLQRMSSHLLGQKGPQLIFSKGRDVFQMYQQETAVVCNRYGSWVCSLWVWCMLVDLPNSNNLAANIENMFYNGWQVGLPPPFPKTICNLSQ